MNIEPFLSALAVAGLSFGFGFVLGAARSRAAGRAEPASVELRSGTLPVRPLTRLPDAQQAVRE
ncbi:hypothetical protein ACTJI2_13540 [Pseudoxanthomonas sp. 22568]|uniref:hypothetical protein n=1 Tax=Pseudoxanthomonas sp. 22568 TaxID=3453945 RepID=UPI003F82CA7F